MNSPFDLQRRNEHGSALLISLTMIVLITVVVLVMAVQTQLDRQLSANNWDDQQARNIAQVGFDSALMRIQETLQPYDDPFGTTNSPTTFWSLSPGRIDQYLLTNGYARPRRLDPVPLHSGYPVANTNDAADLNAPDGFGNRPIWSEARKMEVDWVPVARNPSEALSNTNPIVGRFAFWVDDEGSKINVNTADGSDNYSLSSYGQGTPMAVSLSVFYDLGDTNAPDQETVRALAAEARRQPLKTISEMATRDLSLTHPVTGVVSKKIVSSKFPATNAFNLTLYSRSPDFNIFNLPKFQLTPSNVGNLTWLAGTNVSGLPFVPVNRMIQYYRFPWYYNSPGGASSAVSALRSLYPGRNQLSGAWTNVYPLMPAYPVGADGMPMAQDGSIQVSGEYPVLGSTYQMVTSAAKRSAVGGTFILNQPDRFAAMAQIERYLLGTNALGNPIHWPFNDANYVAKYNLRQLDSITLQIFEMARAVNVGGGWLGAADSGGGNVNDVQSPGIAPYGILGDKPVMSAMGRYPRMTRVLARFSLTERPGARPRKNATEYFDEITYQLPDNPPPPGKNVGDLDPTLTLYDGANLQSWIAFSMYQPKHLYDPDTYVGNTLVDNSFYGIIPFGWSGAVGFNEMDWVAGTGSLVNPVSRWMDTLFYAEAWDSATGDWEPGNSSGIDFRGNNPYAKDPDPRADILRRAEYRSVNIDTTGTNATWVTNTQAWGTGYDPHRTRPLLYYDIYGPNPEAQGPGLSVFQNFAPHGAHYAGSLGKNFPTRNLGEPIEKIRLRGGLTVRLRQSGMHGITPLENISGPMAGGTTNPLAVMRSSLTNDSEVAAWRATATNRVIPIFGKDGLELAFPSASIRNVTRYVVAKVRDPLISQLPGDWVVKTSASLPGTNVTGNPAIFTTWPRNDYSYGSMFTPNTTFDYLPEPEWVDMAADSGAMGIALGQPNSAVSSSGSLLQPYLENGVQKISETVNGGVNNNRVINLSKQLSFPSVGRLQYLRTGAMPDNENAQPGEADYAGMPFRCLNFGPANTQGGIPDWAMLDLFTVPNAVWTTPASRFAISGGPPTLIHLTYGGASTGKINLNGSVLWPWAEDDTNFVRSLPLAAQFHGLRYNQNGRVQRTKAYGSSASTSWNQTRLRVTTATNSWNVVSGPAAQSLSEAIATYIRQNGPLAMPGQMSDIPAVNAYGAEIPTMLNGESLLPPLANGTPRTPTSDNFYAPGIHSEGINRTRNDIVSQSIGNLVTQGNVFAVWVMGQSIKKSDTSDPEKYEPEKGDRVVAQTRLRFLLERKLDPGSDGVYGNSSPNRTGTDGVLGTPDDLHDPSNTNDVLNHPRNPKFIYQVINVQEIQ